MQRCKDEATRAQMQVFIKRWLIERCKYRNNDVKNSCAGLNNLIK